MYYLYHSFLGNEIYYVRVNNDNTWDEIYNPNHATPFGTQEEAIQWSKENTTFGDYALAVDVREAEKDFYEWQEKGMIRRSFNIVDRGFSRPYKYESPEEVLHWRIRCRSAPDHEVRYEDYKTWPDLYEVFNHLWSVEAYQNPVFTDPDLLTFQMYVCSDSRFSEFEKELELILPHITYLDEDGYKIIPIFDRFLGEGGNFVYFHYKDPSDCFITGRWHEDIKGTLEEVFKYWRAERYYE